MKYRSDHCRYLIHFTKGESYEDAYNNLVKIMHEKNIRCGTGFIKKSECCICFTETPMECLSINNFLDSGYFDRYSPFGIMFSKNYIFDLGGRPVIYGPDEDYNKLHDDLKYRYVKFDPPIDFTWEREWRLNKSDLTLRFNEASIILPSGVWAERLIEEHYAKEIQVQEDCRCKNDILVLQYSQILDEEIARLYFEEECSEPNHFQFQIIKLQN